MPRVFISSTSTDLERHRYVARDAVSAFGWNFKMMEDFESQTRPTVAHCCREVCNSDLVLLILAFRWGSVPTIEQGGDGVHSYTWFEVEAAKRHGVPIRALLADESSPWPPIDFVGDLAGASKAMAWRGELNRIGAKFEYEAFDPNHPLKSYPRFRQLVVKALGDHREELSQLEYQLTQSMVGSHWLSGDVGTAMQLAARHLGGLTLPVEQVRAVYRRIHPQGAEPISTTSPHFLAEALQQLIRLPRRMSDGGHAVFDFLSELPPLAEDDRRRMLIECLSARSGPVAATPAPTIGLSDSTTVSPASPAPTHVDPAAFPSTSDPFPVVVSFRESMQGKSYEVRAWHYEEETPTELPLEKTVWTSKNRSDLLGRLCDQAQRRAGGRRLLFEFLVPRELLAQELEDWKAMLDDFGEVKVGVLAPVVIRTVERLRPVPFERWKARWSRIQSLLAAPCRMVDMAVEPAVVSSPAAIEAIWIGGERDGAQVFALLDGRAEVACAVLDKAPKVQAGGRQMDAFRAALLAGVPIIVWPRKTTSAKEQLRADLLALLDGHPLERLPWRMHGFRQDQDRRTDRREKKVGLALVWDDPRRPVPQPAEAPPLYLEQQAHDG